MIIHTKVYRRDNENVVITLHDNEPPRYSVHKNLSKDWVPSYPESGTTRAEIRALIKQAIREFVDQQTNTSRIHLNTCQSEEQTSNTARVPKADSGKAETLQDILNDMKGTT